MDQKDIDFEKIKERLVLFARRPEDLLIASVICVILAGLLPCAHRHVERDMASYQQIGFSGFHVLGLLLWITIAAFAASTLSRVRASFNVPRHYCDRACYALSLFCLVRIYIFLQSAQTTTSGFFFFFSIFQLYFTPAIGAVFLLIAPALLWRATHLENEQVQAILQDQTQMSPPEGPDT
ncbi:hypothetical protein BAR24_12945 [Gluconobacter oxydans]|uniref:hypothetical protein n=1 Tax=Gluconobacter thailandicus TaxID=257438 RepID=UPI0002998B75|nr:hypothetical protein [Gluconobacter thailandicus]AFW02176.1 hypothetical protein B932_2625 [Gluconobacter oxydans H24]ANQ42285.1 hypothetical protein BAR24_12945 [Gluconobacter oxydans]